MRLGLGHRQPAPEPQPKPREVIAAMGEPFVSVLCSMYAGEPQLGADGETHAMDSTTRIAPEQGMLIYELMRDTKPENSLEIGLAFGFSTVYFLAAIAANGKGHHVAVDHPTGRATRTSVEIAREKVVSAAPGVFEFVSETSIQSLTRFAREQRKFGVIHIDGSHRFDDVLIDFSLASLVCEPDGYILLDDMWMPSIQRVASFIRLNRYDFTEISSALENVAVFRMTGSDKRKWDHFVPF